MDSFDPVTRQGLEITNLFWLELIISALLLALVVGWLALALLRYRARPGDAGEPAQVHGNTRLEIIWTSIPVLVLAVVFVLVVQTMRSVDAAEPDAQRLEVIGHQWWWEFRYPDLGVVTANEVSVPLGSSLLISLDSEDVIHSLWVPRFGLMRDAIPGKTNYMTIRVDRPGAHDGACTQYCGLQHAWMRERIIGEPRDRFDAWIAQQQLAASSSGSAGEGVFLQNTCVNCHAIRGLAAQAQVGPDLTHLASRSTIGAGVLANTPANLRDWIRNAQAIKPGVLMPAYPNLSEEELGALVDFLGSLR
ncbi:MAG: cytochrome c oxidase subunit II [Chloroflexota bacterium]|nr:cytochrome c oxidase subunit II [Chloroflexota bacterium]